MKNAALELKAVVARVSAERLVSMPFDKLRLLALLLKDVQRIRETKQPTRPYALIEDLEATIAEILAPDALGSARIDRAREIYEGK